MKKLLILTAICCLFAAKSFSQEIQKIRIVATASMIADMAKNIVGDKMEVMTIVPIGGDPHTYRPTPADAKLIVSANLVLMNGLTFEGWLEDLVKNSGTKAPVVMVTEGMEYIKSTAYDSPDPHAWMDVQKGIEYANNIKRAVSNLNPSNKNEYQANFLKYKQELMELDEYILEAIATISQDKRILITSHDAFQYYGRRYDLRLESVLGISTDADVQTEDVIQLQKVIKESKVPAVFVESTVNPKLLEQLARDNGIIIGGKLLSDSLGDEAFGGETYIKMMKYNTDVIVAGLTGKTQEIAAEEGEAGTENMAFTIVVAGLFLAGFFYMFRKMK
ncbi:MAG: zinc ABC transporter substrate-binding protein [Bacteroidota bacterium]